MMIPYLGVWLCLALMHSKLTRTIKWLETSGHVTPGHVGPRCDAIFKKMHVGHPGMVSGATYICVCIYTYTDIQIYIYYIYIHTLYIDIHFYIDKQYIHIQRWIFHIYRCLARIFPDPSPLVSQGRQSSSMGQAS